MYFEHSRKTLLGLSFSLILSTSVLAEQRFYPRANPKPIAVGSEEFKENYASLAGLEGVHVVTRYLSRSARRYDIEDMDTDLPAQISARLKTVGLRMLDEQELESTPGQPTLIFYPSYSGNENDTVFNIRNLSPYAAELSDKQRANSDYCRSAIWASFMQSASILREPNKQFKFITWGSGDNTTECENRGRWTSNAVIAVIDKFISDYQKAEIENASDAKLKPVSNVNEVPEDCDQAWSVNLNVFENSETRISDAVKPILDELAKAATRCEQHRYIIQTHAALNDNADYNRIVSEARAHAIKDYLLSKKIAYDRLETVAFGSTQQLAHGTAVNGYTANRRVVIIPQL